MIKTNYKPENPNLAERVTILDDGSCSSDPSLGRLEPPNGRMYLGFQITWDDLKPQDVVNALGGKIPSVL